MANTRKKKRGRTLGWVAGAVALGMGAGIAAERLLVGRDRLRPDPHGNVPYGRIKGNRRFEVSTGDGATLLAEEFGDASSSSGVIFAHGYCLDRTIWHHQLIDMRNGKLIAYDARHHGASYGGPDETDSKVLASDLRAVLEASDLEHVVLAGHSMGGMTVLEFCRQFPAELMQRVRGVVLINTTYTDVVKTLFAAEVIGPLERRIRRVIEGLLNDPRSSRLLTLRGDDLSWILVRQFGFGKNASPAQVSYTRRLLASFPSPPLVEILRGLREFDMEDALGAIDVPCLILAGGDDRVTTVRASQKMMEEIPGARLHVFEGAGHMSMMEREKEFTALVGDFVSDTLPS